MGWSELILIGIVALIVVGPKDLPVMFHAMGKMMAKVRRMAREFQTAMSEAAEQSGANDLKKEMGDLTSPRNMGMDALSDAADRFDKWDPTKPSPSKKPGAAKKTGPATQKLAEDRAAAAAAAKQKAADIAEQRTTATTDAAAPAKTEAKSE
ncbi:Sec-independent protein translocase protein TatB [Pseudaestuariivita rosea]|uniref:Sec-independent protein translocase protein TatB n=1 Tax=Pseudaestuariivita rosea TaxID=2763263 RepID=UPI001ABAD3D5